MLRRFLSNIALGLQVFVFALVCVICLPMILFHILFQFGVDWVCEGIEARWPDSDWARAASFWVRLLAPFVLNAVLLVVVVVLALRVRELQQSGTAPG